MITLLKYTLSKRMIVSSTFCLTMLLLFSSVAFAQGDGIGIGTTTVDPSAVLDIRSTGGTKGLLIPRVPDRMNVNTTSTSKGVLVYDTGDDGFYYYFGNDAGGDPIWLRLVTSPSGVDIDLNDHKIINVENGTGPKDAVNRSQLDTKITNASGTVNSTHIATNAVKAPEIAAGAVGSSEIATNAVKAPEIAAGAVGSSEIATNAVKAAEISNGAVTPAKIQKGAIVASGTRTLGNIPGGGARYTITFTPAVTLTSTNYNVLITIRTNNHPGVNRPWNDDFVTYTVYDTAPTSFKIELREFRGDQSPGFGFDWAIMKR